MKFSELKFTKHPRGGVMARHTFANGFGVSVVKFPGSYGWLDGLYEMAVLLGGKVCNTTDITSDVLGYLTHIDVEEFMAQVEMLNADGHLPEGVGLYSQVGEESEQAMHEADVILAADIKYFFNG